MHLIGATAFGFDRDSGGSDYDLFPALVAKPMRGSELLKALSGTGTPSAHDPAPVDPEPNPASGARVTGRKALVLLAEDNPVNQELGREYLERQGCSVRIAGNGAEAVSLYREGAFDLVLMDVQMPEIDGIEATRRIRRLEASSGRKRVPIVAATAHAFQEDRESCLSAGMDDFLSKPFTRNELAPLLDRWLGATEPVERAAVRSVRVPDAPLRSPPHDNLLDETILAQLRSLDPSGENRVFRRVARMFIDGTPAELASLRDRADNGDLAALGTIAHSLKTSAANVAAVGLSDLFRQLEAAVREGRHERCRAIVSRIGTEFDDVQRALSDRINDPVPSRLRA